MRVSRRAFIAAGTAAIAAAALPAVPALPGVRAPEFNGLVAGVDLASGPSSSALIVAWSENGVHRISLIDPAVVFQYLGDGSGERTLAIPRSRR